MCDSAAFTPQGPVSSSLGSDIPLWLEGLYEGHLESKERFAIQRYLLIIGKKKKKSKLRNVNKQENEFQTESKKKLRNTSPLTTMEYHYPMRNSLDLVV